MTTRGMDGLPTLTDHLFDWVTLSGNRNPFTNGDTCLLGRRTEVLFTRPWGDPFHDFGPALVCALSLEGDLKNHFLIKVHFGSSLRADEIDNFVLVRPFRLAGASLAIGRIDRKDSSDMDTATINFIENTEAFYSHLLGG